MRTILSIAGLAFIVMAASLRAEPPDPERGRIALTTKSFLPPAWPLDAYKKAGSFWGDPDAPDPDRDPEAYAAAFRNRYGLHPAPFPNDGLPMGLRRSQSQRTGRIGLQIDCLACHGGSIGGQSYIGLGNTQLDLKRLLDDLTRASGRVPVPLLFTINSTRGTNNAGQMGVFLFSLRNPDLSFRKLPKWTGANFPELDTPAWWGLKHKTAKYYDGGLDARAVRSNMSFLLGDLSLDELKALEPTFQDIDAYFRTLQPPKYPFAIDPAQAEQGRALFAAHCAKCHGTYGPADKRRHPNRVVDAEIIGTDIARARGSSAAFADHYNSTWYGADHPMKPPTKPAYQAPPLDGVWATAPYLHNGSVPTLHHLLKSSDRPNRFRRPPSTDFAEYDPVNVGWTFQVVDQPLDPKTPPHEARSVYDAARWGLGNAGHTFGDRLSDEQRRQVIEYLKTL